MTLGLLMVPRSGFESRCNPSGFLGAGPATLVSRWAVEVLGPVLRSLEHFEKALWSLMTCAVEFDDCEVSGLPVLAKPTPLFCSAAIRRSWNLWLLLQRPPTFLLTGVNHNIVNHMGGGKKADQNMHRKESILPAPDICVVAFQPCYSHQLCVFESGNESLNNCPFAKRGSQRRHRSGRGPLEDNQSKCGPSRA